MVIRDAVGEEDRSVEPFDGHLALLGGAGAGFVAAVAMGLTFVLFEPALLRDYVPGLYGFAGSLVVGWLAHLGHGILFGLVFAVVMDDPSLVSVSGRIWTAVLAGVVFGIVLAVVGTGIVLPMWSRAAGFSPAPAIPFVTAALLVGHVVFGAVLGALFHVVDRL